MVGTKIMTYNSVIFDFDGTLVDTSPGVVSCFRMILEKRQIYAWSDKDIQSFIGIPIRKIFRTLLKTDANDVIERAVEDFRALYQDHGLMVYTLFPGTEAMLRNLHKSGKRLFIVSNKFENFIHPILRDAHIDRFFTGVIGAALRDSPDKSMLVAICLKTYAIDAATAIMVGDTRGDIEAGRTNNLHAIGVTFGYGKKEDLEQAGADGIVPTVQSLAQALSTEL